MLYRKISQKGRWKILQKETKQEVSRIPLRAVDVTQVRIKAVARRVGRGEVLEGDLKALK